MRGKHYLVLVSFLILSVYFLCASVDPASAKLYKWKDDQGATHYTDNENNIPLKYRSKDKIERLKGMSSPRKLGSVAPKETPGEEPVEEGAGEEETPEAGTGGEEEGGSSEADSETLAFLTEVKSFLELELSKHRRLLQAVPADEKNGKYLIMPVKANAPKKFAMADKIKESGLKALKPVSRYLLTSAELDSEGRVGGENYLGRIVDLKARMEREVLEKEKLVKIVDDEIAKSK